jgi:hypothetical protein
MPELGYFVEHGLVIVAVIVAVIVSTDIAEVGFSDRLNLPLL